MLLYTAAQKKRLLANAKATLDAQSQRKPEPDHKPVIKLFNPVGAGTWLFTEMDENEIAFGLCDLGMGIAELGYQSITEMRDLKLPLGLGIERDYHYEAESSLSEYAKRARIAGHIDA
jgi:hypothetical protein